jgi:type I restriction enzyme S subunit
LAAARVKADRHLRSYLHQLFGGAPERGWSNVTLGDVADVKIGRQLSPKHSGGDKMRPYIRAGNITWDGLDLREVKEMSFTDTEMATYRLEAGDILVNEASGSASEVGKAVRFGGEIEDCGFQNHVYRVRVHGADPDYVLQFLRYNAESGAYLEQSHGLGIRTLGKAKLTSWPIPLPALELQASTALAVEARRTDLGRVTRCIDLTLSKAEGLRRSLLHAAFTGELTRTWRDRHNG